MHSCKLIIYAALLFYCRVVLHRCCFHRYKFVAEIDEASGAIYNIMKPPARTEERLSWDKSIAHYERLLAVNDVRAGMSGVCS